MIPLGTAAKYLRDRLGLSQRAAAQELGISYVHLNNIENGKASPSPEMLEKFRDAWGIDLYMLAVGMFSDKATLPAPLRKPLSALTKAWSAEIESLIEMRRKEVLEKCSAFSD